MTRGRAASVPYESFTGASLAPASLQYYVIHQMCMEPSVESSRVMA